LKVGIISSSAFIQGSVYFATKMAAAKGLLEMK